MVEIRGVTKSFGNHLVIPKLDLTIQKGEFMVLVGPSGCGKSTLLRMVAGLESVDSGTLLIDGTVVNDKSPKERGVAMVFQNYALYPHMSVRENIAFSLKLSKMPHREINAKVNEAAKVLRLEDHLDKRPGQLSGGQKQRVAMGRAMVREPRVLLFDEPLSNLDAQLRVKMRAEISHLHQRYRSTIIYVTHDQVEAMTLANRIAVMNQGHIEQVGAPLDVYHHPQTEFVASFIGIPSMNFLPSNRWSQAPKTAKMLGFRPESLLLGSGKQDAFPIGKAKVRLVEPLGTSAHVHLVVVDNSNWFPLVAETKMEGVPTVGSEIPISVDTRHLFFFDSEGKAIEGAR